MKKFIENYFMIFFKSSLTFRVKLYNMLAMAGTVISFSMFVNSALEGNVGNVIINIVLTFLSAGLLIYSYKSGRYQLCYGISIFGIFMILFPLLFFTGGGYHSGMPLFFIFAVIFTVLMLEQWWAIIVAMVEVGLYTIICMIAYRHPESIVQFTTEKQIVTDIVVCLIAVCIACGAVLYFHLTEYMRQKEELAVQNEKLRKYDEMKSTFLTTVAHEIKNPLTAISIHARDTSELLNEEPQEKLPMKENLKSIEEVVTCIDRIVVDLMDTVSIEQGRLALSLAPIRLATLINEACTIYFESSNENGNILNVEIDNHLESIYGDYARLLQVVNNILSNASRHTKSGVISIALTEGDNCQVINISDNGEGMNDRVKAHAFKGYTSASKDYWRHGIGLFVCHQIVIAHGGEIWIESELGKGTTVSFTVPIKEEYEDE